MIRKNFKIALLVSMIVTILIPFSTMEMASASTNETTDTTTDKNADYFKRHGFSQEFVKKLREKHAAYQKLGDEASTYYKELKTLGDSLEDQTRKAELKEKIRILEAQKDKIIPRGKTVHIPESLFKKMNEAKDRIFYSGLPWFELYVSTSTGKLTVVIDKEKTLDIDDKIIKLAGKNIPLDIKYRKNTMELQSSCESGSKGYCDPVIGGGFITNDANGLPCTIGLAAQREVRDWFGNLLRVEDGIIIPDHCNLGDYMMQNTWNDETDRFGKETDDGGWYCDCDFIKSDGRTINTDKINNNGTDITISGKTDLVKYDLVTTIAGVSGQIDGMIVETNVSMQFENSFGDLHTFSNLYKIESIELMSGDSGSPILNSDETKFVGMNIGGGASQDDSTWYQYGHEWSFLKERMELKD